MLKWKVNLGLGCFAKGCQVKIANHTHDLAHRRLAGSDGTAGLDPFPERIFAAKIFVHEALRDDSDRRRVNVVAFSEVAAAQQRHAQCFEEIGRDNIDLDGWLLAFRHWMFLNVGRERDLASTQWNPPGRAGGLDTGRLTNAL